MGGTVDAGHVVDPVAVVAPVLDWEQADNRPVMFGADSGIPEPMPMSAIPVTVQRRRTTADGHDYGRFAALSSAVSALGITSAD